MLPADASARSTALDFIHRVTTAGGESDEIRRRLARVDALFEACEAPAAGEVGQGHWTVAAVQDRSPMRGRKGTPPRQGAADEVAPKTDRN
jgi:hypothetical protein